MSSRKRRHTKASFSDVIHPNFEELAREFPDFGKAYGEMQQHQKEHGGSLATNVTQEFSIALTRALLYRYFSLSLPYVPSLCPPVPQRYFFVRWVQLHLLPLVKKLEFFQQVPSSQAEPHSYTGIDLGTGATCIYPLLFCAPSVDIQDHQSTNNWKWFASEVDAKSTELARQNVQANRLESKIHVIQVPPTDSQVQQSQHIEDMECDEGGGESPTSLRTGPIIRLLETLPPESKPTNVSVVLTNPPFHEPDRPIVSESTRTGDQRARTALTEGEASYPGGELNFLIDMVVDSLRLLPHPSGGEADAKNNGLAVMMNVTWYSSMFGKKTSWIHMIQILTYMLGPARVQSTEFGPGKLTRWFLAWTYHRPNVRSPMAVYYHQNHTADDHTQNKSNKSKQNTSFSFDVTIQEDNELGGSAVATQVVDRVMEYCRTLPGYNLTSKVTTKTDTTQVVTVQEQTPLVMDWDGKKLPAPILQVLRARDISFMSFLPGEGHFLIDITVKQQSSVMASVHVQGYLHSIHGREVFDKIKSQIEPEICRTNRRWRRFLQRQQQQNAKSVEQPMETT